MRTYLSVCRKEMLLLLRDKAGLAMLFIMPMVLILISSLMQESGWGELTKDPKVDLLFVDNDDDSLGYKIRNGFAASPSFHLIDSLDGKPLTEAMARTAVAGGKYTIAIVVPSGSTSTLQSHVRMAVTRTLAGFGLGNPFLLKLPVPRDSVNVIIYFDPAVKRAFRNALVSSARENYYRIQTSWIFDSFNREMALQIPGYTPQTGAFGDILTFREEYPGYRETEMIPNTTQHNVPAWTIFAMFFIVIPLTQSLIQEREGGSLFRLLTMPVPYMTFLMGKVGVYLVVCLLQTAVMLLTGILLLPLAGLPMLEIGNEVPGVAAMAFTVALASVGYGLMVGTIARTHQQAAAFGSISIIILAAMGGLWVPIYLMPDFMRTVSQISPLNWAITGFYSILLRGGDIIHVIPEMTKLIIFFLGTVAVTALYQRHRRSMNN